MSAFDAIAIAAGAFALGYCCGFSTAATIACRWLIKPRANP